MMWVWFALSAICLILELMTGAFFLLFISIGLLAAGVLAFFELHLYWSLGAFALISLSSIFFLRVFGIRKSPAKKPALDKNVNLDIGTSIFVNSWNGNRRTQVNYRGAQWQAILADHITSIPENSGYYKIMAINGLVLVLEPVGFKVE